MKTALLAAALASMPVHEFYSQNCCRDRDCHPVPCEEIVSTENGWIWHSWRFARTMLQDAPDGQCHVCVHPMGTPITPLKDVPMCIYLPPRT